MRIRKTVLAFTVPAVIVVAVSVLITLRRGDAMSRPEPAAFSGSRVIQRMPSLLPSPRLGTALSVAIVRDAAAAGYYDSPAALDSIIATWRRILGDVGARVRVVSSSAIGGARDAQVLLVPSSPCLTIATREALEHASATGQGIMVTGLTGVHDAGCRPIGMGLVVALTGASRAEVLDNRDMVYVTIPAGSRLAVDIPPGARLGLSPGTQVALRKQGRDAFYSDYALHVLPARGQPLLDGALAHGQYGRSRIVYWGFEPRDADRQPWNQAIVRLLARNSLAWVASARGVSVEPWPHGKRAAAAIAQDVEDRFANSRHALDSLRAAGVPATFFLTSNLALRFDDLARDLDRAGEIGTHSENHRRLGGLSLDEQRQRLAVTQRELESLLGLPVLGLRPPAEQFDSATMAAWLAVGGTYLFGANDSRSASPELLPIGRDTLVLLGRGGGDDFALVAHARNPDSMVTAFVREYEHARALGGLFVLSYHSQLLGRPELVPALARVARALKADSTTWLATTGDIAAWWRGRAELSLTLRQPARNTLQLLVRNRGTHIVDGAVAQIRLDAAPKLARSALPLLPSDRDVVRVQLPPLMPGSTRTFTVMLSDERAVRPTSRPSARRVQPPKKRSWFPFWR